jgi:hypothetical protein
MQGSAGAARSLVGALESAEHMTQHSNMARMPHQLILAQHWHSCTHAQRNICLQDTLP